MLLVTFLGTSKYQAVRYSLDGEPAGESPYIARALCGLLQINEVVVLATGDAWRKNGEGLQSALTEVDGLEVRKKLLPVGSSEEDLWAQYQVLQEVLTVDAPDGIVLDITHGFRSQPFFAAVVVALLRMAGLLPENFRIVYGAFEAKGTDGSAPIWDLTVFTELLSWAHGAAVFTATGHGHPLVETAVRADRLQRRAVAERQREGGGRLRFPKAGKLVEALREFTADLDTLRIAHLVTGYEKAHERKAKARGSAGRLLEALSVYEQEVEVHLPALAPLLGEVRRVATGLAAPTLSGPRGQRAMAELARRYLHFGRYPEAAIVLREALVSAHATPEGAEVNCAAFDPQARAGAEREWRESDKDGHRTVAKVRNDIEHGGFNADPQPAGTLAEQVKELVEQYLPLEDGTEPSGRVWFVSRHPGAAEWAKRQGIEADRFVEHLDPREVVQGDVVIGTLPVHLVARLCERGARYLHLSLDVPPGLRGREMSAVELDRCKARLEAFRVLPACHPSTFRR